MALARLIHAHDDRAWVHNASLRAAHAAFLASHLGGDGLKDEKRIALMTRLRDALRHAGYVASPESKRKLAQQPAAPAAADDASRRARRHPPHRRALQRRHREK